MKQIRLVVFTLRLSVLFLFRFVEYGRYQGHYYGSSLNSVNRVMTEGKVCLLDMHPSVSLVKYDQTSYHSYLTPKIKLIYSPRPPRAKF